MGSRGGPRGPSPEEKRDIAKGHWEQYQQWGFDARKGYEQSSSSTKARMSAAGIKAGSAQWTRNLQAIDAKYQKDIKGIKRGATAGILQDYYKEQLDKAAEDEWIKQQSKNMTQAQIESMDALGGLRNRGVPDDFKSQYAKSFGSMEDFMQREFGILKEKGPTKAEQASTRASEASSGGRAAAAASRTQSPTRSPWW